MNRLNGDMLTGSAVMLLGLAALAMSFTIGNVTWGGESSRLFPMIVAVSLTGFGARLVLTGLRNPTDHTSGTMTTNPEMWRVGGLALLGMCYVATIGKIGYVVSTGIVAPVALWIFGVRSPWGLAVSALLCPLMYHLIFFVALGVYPPYAPWLAPLSEWPFLPWNG